MRIVKPETVDGNNLTSTNVVNDVADWAAGTYNLGDQAVYEHRVYEVVADPSTTDRPDLGAEKDTPTWVVLGWDNQFSMFREGSDSKTKSTDTIVVELAVTNIINTLGVLGLVGNSVRLEMVDSVDGVVYDKTIELPVIGVSDWWEWHFAPYDQRTNAVFDGLPPYPDTIVTLTISALNISDPVECGRVVYGLESDIGSLQYGTGVGSVDYSIKERDGFGNLTLVPRRTVKRVDFDLVMPTTQVSYIQRELSSVAAQPTLFIGNDATEATVLFGVYRDFDITVSSPTVSYGTVEVEGF